MARPTSSLNPRFFLLAVLVAVGSMVSCGDFYFDQPEVTLRPILFKDRSAPLLLRPLGVGWDPLDGSIVVVESGRRTLTLLGPTGVVRERRTLRPADLPPGVTSLPGYDIGASLVRSACGYWTTLEGLGPLFIPDDPRQPVRLLGAGSAGLVPQDGLRVASADLSDVRGVAVDNQDNLLVAVNNQVFRVLPEGLDLLVGTGIDPWAHAEPEDQLILSFGTTVGLAMDPQGNLYLGDAGSASIWRVNPDGAAEVIAGGGDRFTPPSEPIAATDMALDLARCQLAWDEGSRELLLLSKSVLYRIGFVQSGEPTDDPTGSRATIRAVPAIMNLPRGLGLGPDGPLVSSLIGIIYLAGDQGSERIWQPAGGAEVALGWADAVERVGLNALLIQDTAQHRISLFLPDSGTYLLYGESSPAFAPSTPLAADPHGHVYFVTAFGLRFVDVNGPTGLVSRRVPEALLDGQSIDEVLLPFEGEIRAGTANDLWLLDPGRHILLHIDTVSGAVVHAAGAIQGGGRPRGDQTNLPELVSLFDPQGLSVRGDLLLLADRMDLGGSVVYAINLGIDEQTLAGARIPADSVAHLGGGGPMPYVPGRPFSEMAVDRVHRLAPLGEDLIVAIEDRFAPPLVRVDPDGLCTEIPLVPRHSPRALCLLENQVLLVGWTDQATLAAINLGEQARSVLGTVVPAGEQETVFALEGPEPGFSDLVSGPSGELFGWTTDGRIVRIGDPLEVLGSTSSQSHSMAVALDGGIYLVQEGGVWAVDASGSAEFLGQPLPGPGGGLVIEPNQGWVSGTRIQTLPFGDNVTGLAVGEDGSLYWTDRTSRALFQAHPGQDGFVEPSSRVDLLNRGEPVGAGQGPLMLEAGHPDMLFLANRDVIYRYQEGRWDRFAGGGEEIPAPGSSGSDILLTGISGMALDQGLIVRTRSGLMELSFTGEVVDVTPVVPSEPLFGSFWSLSQSVDMMDGHPVVVVSGELYQVVGWPR